MSNDEQLFTALPGVVQKLRTEIAKKVVGQDAVIEEMLISLFSNGHCLFVGVPGLAKTLMVNSVAEALGLDFNRIQFTPDLMPSDITGAEILQIDPDSGQRTLQFVEGPVFTNLLLADEINRTPPKTQAALLEAMQERQVTTLGATHRLSAPFLVFATQNPVEQEGTYPLPEAALDRFMFSISVGYPTAKEEKEIVRRVIGLNDARIEAVLSLEELLAYQRMLKGIPVSDELLSTIVRLVALTRPQSSPVEAVRSLLRYGAGTRASIYLSIAARTRAAIYGHDTASIEDLKAVAKTVLRHRIFPNFQAQAQRISADDIIDDILEQL
mgnify:CR=1 FL=1